MLAKEGKTIVVAILCISSLNIAYGAIDHNNVIGENTLDRTKRFIPFLPTSGTGVILI